MSPTSGQPFNVALAIDDQLGMHRPRVKLRALDLAQRQLAPGATRKISALSSSIRCATAA
jgi:hypothetical protein